MALTDNLVDLVDPADNLPQGFTKINTNFTDLDSTVINKGASLIGIYDVAGNFTATDVEAALAELASSISGFVTTTELAAQTSGNGASLVGIYDVKDHFTSTNVEAVLAEIITRTDTAEFLRAVDGGDLVYPYFVPQSNIQYDTGTGRLTSVQAVYDGSTYTMAFTYNGPDSALSQRQVTGAGNTDTNTITYSGGQISDPGYWVRA